MSGRQPRGTYRSAERERFPVTTVFTTVFLGSFLRSVDGRRGTFFSTEHAETFPTPMPNPPGTFGLLPFSYHSLRYTPGNLMGSIGAGNAPSPFGAGDAPSPSSPTPDQLTTGSGSMSLLYWFSPRQKASANRNAGQSERKVGDKPSPEWTTPV